MSHITADELELLGFFGVEPKCLDPDVPWPYNDFVYEVHNGELSLAVALAGIQGRSDHLKVRCGQSVRAECCRGRRRQVSQRQWSRKP